MFNCLLSSRSEFNLIRKHDLNSIIRNLQYKVMVIIIVMYTNLIYLYCVLSKRYMMLITVEYEPE